MDDSKTLKNIENRLSAILAILAVAAFGNSEEKRSVKPEIALHNAGLENSEIARILGKQLSAVQKTIQRAKK
jgi:DNA-directed RNA polymerase specialized sigma24 family protein